MEGKRVAFCDKWKYKVQCLYVKSAWKQRQAHLYKHGVSVSATTDLTSDSETIQSLLPFPSPGKLSKVLRKLDTDGIKRNREIICQYNDRPGEILVL